MVAFPLFAALLQLNFKLELIFMNCCWGSSSAFNYFFFIFLLSLLTRKNPHSKNFIPRIYYYVQFTSDSPTNPRQWPTGLFCLVLYSPSSNNLLMSVIPRLLFLSVSRLPSLRKSPQHDLGSILNHS